MHRTHSQHITLHSSLTNHDLWTKSGLSPFLEKKKFYWITTTLLCLYIFCGCFHTAKAELGICYRLCGIKSSKYLISRLKKKKLLTYVYNYEVFFILPFDSTSSFLGYITGNCGFRSYSPITKHKIIYLYCCLPRMETFETFMKQRIFQDTSKLWLFSSPSKFHYPCYSNPTNALMRSLKEELIYLANT